jgi:hypothetical protein
LRHLSSAWPACLLRLIRLVVAYPSYGLRYGGCLPQASTSALQLESEGLFSAADSSACSVLRRLGLLGTPRCGAGQRRRTALAASAAKGDMACSELRRGCFSTTEFLRCGTTSDDGAGDFFGLLARWRRLARGGSSEMFSSLCGDLQLDLVLRAGHLFVLLRRQSLRRVWSVEPCGGFVRSPRTRE